ncbi:unnamed protein product [Microthlaspi erraticum]|uniref:Arabidopsis retrotransposon Orf1 C-terminal domain-containing protein n=1 Tax=Microthlaspi erraticum TaxID=1685480 RepID=A0A6D2JB93_9BRAS|nr:unnamed protein product [Microthlaspi erraticum]
MGDSNSSSHIHWLDPPSFSCPNPELTTVVRGENIDFRPPVYTLVGHEDDLREEEPELDRAESIELSRAEDRAEEKSRRVRIWRIGLLQKFNKWQGKAIEKMQKSMDKMVSKIKSLEKKVSGSSSKKKKSKAPTFLGVDLLTTPRRLPAQEPHRASSFEPREGEDNTQRRRKTSKARRSSSTTGLDRVQTEETQLDRADGRVDLEEPQFEDPGFEYDPMPYQEPPRSRWNPYGQYELPSSTKAKEATHFEMKRKRRASSIECKTVEWSAPDGRLPSPDHDLVSQFFGGH